MLWEIFWRKKTPLSLGFTLSFSLLCLIWQGNIFARGANNIGKLADRISGALNSTLRLSGDIWVELDKYRELEARYGQARKLLEKYRLEQDKFALLRMQNAKLRSELGFPEMKEIPELRAEVLAVRLNSISPRIIINRGRAQGVAIYMPVIARTHDAKQNLIRAAVGIVIATDENTSVVQPLTHADFHLGVRIAGSGEWAILSGNSGRISEVILTYISSDGTPSRATISDTEFHAVKGSHIITSGAAGIFPGGIPVGRLLRAGSQAGEFKTVFVKPYAAIGSLDFVSVLLKRPAVWSPSDKSREKKWEEHLMTPFGEPQYPDMDPRLAPRKIKPAVQRSEKPKPVTSVNSQRPTDSQRSGTKPNGRVAPLIIPDKKPSEKVGPRRLKNLRPPENR